MQKKEEVKEWESFNKRLEKATHDWEFVASITDQKEREQFEQELARELADFERAFERARRLKLFSGTYDKNNALLSVYAGAGGRMRRIGLRCCCACISGMRKIRDGR